MSKRCKALKIAQGTTYVQTFRWGADPLVYKSITAKVPATPLTLTVPTHGLPPNWSVAFSGVGYTELTADDWPPDADDFFEATSVDSSTVEFNDIDTTRLTGAYTAGGSIVYMTPVDLTGANASFTVYDAAGTLLLTVAAALNNTAKTISVTITAIQTAALPVGNYTYALTATDFSGAVTLLADGDINIFALGADT